MAWLRGARCTDPGNAGDGSAAPGEKSPRWSAKRRASHAEGRKAPRKRLACRVISAFTRVFDALRHAPRVPRTHPNVSRRSAHPSVRGEWSEVANPGRRNVPREGDGLFDIVIWLQGEVRPHPEERTCRRRWAKSIARMRASKD